MTRLVWSVVVLALAVIVGRCVDHALRRRLGGRFDSPWREPEVSPAREGAGLLVLVVAVLAGTLLTFACPFRIE